MSPAPIRLKDWLDDPERNVRKLNIDRLAGEAGCSPPYMSQVVNERRRPSPDLANKLQEITGIDARHLLGIKVPKETAQSKPTVSSEEDAA